MTEYEFLHTDGTKDPFIVRPYTVNGPRTPIDATMFSTGGATATTANTSLAFVGKGVVDYNVVQQNLLYLLEHCASPTPPVYPTQGQLWYKNADTDANTSVPGLQPDPAHPTDPVKRGLYVCSKGHWEDVNAHGLWDGVIINDRTLNTVDVNGSRIVNVGTPTASTDAATKQYVDSADSNFVLVAGDTMLGPLILAGNPTVALGAATKQYVDSAGGNFVPITGGTMTGPLILDANPTAALEAVPKQYVDNLTLDSLSGVDLALPLTTNDTLVYNGTYWVNSGGFLPLIGGTVTGPITLDYTPTAGDHAVSKQYVDDVVLNDLADVIITSPVSQQALVYDGTNWINQSISGGGTADGVVYAGNMVGTSLVLDRTTGLPSVTVTGIAPASHTHTSTAVTTSMIEAYSMSTLYPASLDGGSYPNQPVADALRTLDQQLTAGNRGVQRQLITGDGVTTTYILKHNMEFNISDNKVHVYANGIKQYASERGRDTVSITTIVDPPTLSSDAGLTPSTAYSFTIAVDGGAATTVTITTPAGPGDYTLYQLLVDIDDELGNLSIPASANTYQGFTFIDFVFESHTTGTGSSVVIADVTLFAGISAGNILHRPSTPGASYAYSLVGLPSDASTTIQFAAPTVNGVVYEILVFP